MRQAEVVGRFQPIANQRKDNHMSYGQSGLHRLHDEFCEEVGYEALQAIGAVVAWGHIRAPRAGSEQWGEVGLDRCGVLRWIQTDADLLALDGKFTNVKMELCANNSGGMKHLEVSAGRFRILIVHDSAPQTLVPISDYAKALARRNHWTLFSKPDESPLPENEIYYVVLFHAKSDAKGEGPSALEIRFPDGDNGYAADHLRLYKLFPNLIDEAWLLRASLDFAAAVAKEEKIKEEAMPKFRRASETGTVE
jgi:hypothetical protein